MSDLEQKAREIVGQHGDPDDAWESVRAGMRWAAEEIRIMAEADAAAHAGESYTASDALLGLSGEIRARFADAPTSESWRRSEAARTRIELARQAEREQV
jgi:hypothetical protein